MRATIEFPREPKTGLTVIIINGNVAVVYENGVEVRRGVVRCADPDDPRVFEDGHTYQRVP